ncbi:MAG TPA: hypothetical protein VMS77_01675 [Conexivisphaerales archaeon]|nr:hypothetical protein [Conexivisphaerales archaeon]
MLGAKLIKRRYSVDKAKCSALDDRDEEEEDWEADSDDWEDDTDEFGDDEEES